MMRLPWHGKTVPHAVLDILRGCNCRCQDCYNADHAHVYKSLPQLKAELDAIRPLRNLTTVSLSGGEPLLHPQILEIVRWLHDQEHLKVASLTNGILLNEKLAAQLAEAGLGLISLHIQKGQRRPDAEDATIDALRREKADLARRHGLFPALVETIAADDAEEFQHHAQFFRETNAFEYSLVTLAGKFGEINGREARPDIDCSTFLRVFGACGFHPTVFVGGRIQRSVPRWYIFQSVEALDGEGRERAWNETRPGLVERAFLWGYALFCRRSLHWVTSTSAQLKVRLLINGLTGGHLSTFFFALKAICRGWKVIEKHIIVQLPPHSLGNGQIEFCEDCPDATARNGRLSPLCLGDIGEEVYL